MHSRASACSSVAFQKKVSIASGLLLPAAGKDLKDVHSRWMEESAVSMSEGSRLCVDSSNTAKGLAHAVLLR